MIPIRRNAVRAVFLTPSQEVLLIHIQASNEGWRGWITPGGGVDDGESELEGLARELHEELGFKLSSPAEKVWTRFHAFSWEGKQYEQTESFYLVKTAKFEPTLGTGLTADEKRVFKEFRWWTLDDIASATDALAPRKLHSLVNDLIQNGPPQPPIDCGI